MRTHRFELEVKSKIFESFMCQSNSSGKVFLFKFLGQHHKRIAGRLLATNSVKIWNKYLEFKNIFTFK